ncbi:hypothetical protein A2U01_0074975, partial [Trifolium medium]|nr:hypothetical protein [Trifolium medium]
VTLAAFSRMDTRVANIEEEIVEIRSTLVDVQKSVKEGHASFIVLMEKYLGKSIVTDEGDSGSVAKTIPENTQRTLGEKIGDSSGGSKVDTLTEFR